MVSIIMRRSALQTFILIELRREPAPSIEKLSVRMGKLRPSVSRSLKLLQADGRVIRSRGAWRLTETGTAEVAETEQSLRELQAQFRDLASNFSPPAAVFEDLSRFAKDVTRLRLELMPQFNATIRQVDALQDSVRQALLPALSATDSYRSLFQIMNQAIAPLLEAQRNTAAETFAALTKPALLSQLEFPLRTANIGLAALVENTLALRSAEQYLRAGEVRSSFGALGVQYAGVARSLGSVWQDAIGQHHDHSPTAASLLEQARQSTIASVNFSDSLRLGIDVDFHLTRPQVPERHSPNIKLTELLSEIGPEYVEMHRGMWAAFDSIHSDYLRHSATSARELVRSVLEFFVPGAILEPDERGSLIRPRVKALIRSDSGAEWVTHFSLGVVGFYKKLNSFTHHDERDRDALFAILLATEGLLLFFINSANNAPKS